MAIAYEGLYKRCGGSGLLILVDVGKMEDTISGDGGCTPHEVKFMRGEGKKLEYKAGRVAVEDRSEEEDGMVDVEDADGEDGFQRKEDGRRVIFVKGG